jgi:16S rRNA processing protein RimM
MRPKFLVVAHITKAQGLNGAVEIVSLTDYPERFAPGVSLLSSPPLLNIKSLTIESVDKRPKGIVLKFAEINSREQADLIAGRDLVVPVENAVDLPEGEFWIHDIVGMEVFTVDGTHVGTVVEVLRTGSNDVYVVQTTSSGEDGPGKDAQNHENHGKEVLIPAIKDVVKSISTEERKIIIDPIPGLLE